jgi:hypothetical protein
MPNALLNIGHGLSGIGFKPASVQLFGCHAELDHQIARKVLRLGLTSFLAPQANQGCFVIAHNNPGIRAANKVAPLPILLPT